MISVIATVLFLSAKVTLGRNYSPCYDSYLPQDIIRTGLYNYVRHPIYLSNILLLIGVFISFSYVNRANPSLKELTPSNYLGNAEKQAKLINKK